MNFRILNYFPHNKYYIESTMSKIPISSDDNLSQNKQHLLDNDAHYLEYSNNRTPNSAIPITFRKYLAKHPQQQQQPPSNRTVDNFRGRKLPTLRVPTHTSIYDEITVVRSSSTTATTRRKWKSPPCDREKVSPDNTQPLARG